MMQYLKTSFSKHLSLLVVSLLIAVVLAGCAHKTALELPESDQEQTTTE